MITALPKVPYHTDRTDLHILHDPPQVQGRAPPLWNALGMTFEGLPWLHLTYAEDAALRRMSAFGLPPALSTALHPRQTGLPSQPDSPAVSGHSPYGHHISPTLGRTSSFLDRTQNRKGDASASSSSTTGASRITEKTILAHIQEVGYTVTIKNLVEMVSTLRRKTTAADWHLMAHEIRMEVVRCFNMTLAGINDIRVSPRDLKAAATGHPDPTWSEATFRAAHVAGLMIELVKAKINSPGDVATAAGQIFERRRCGGYLLLMQSLLQAARGFLFPYNSILNLRGMKGRLRLDNGPRERDIVKVIDSLRYPPQRRR